MSTLRNTILAALLSAALPALAGGPLYVAGTSGFNPGLAGTPVTWTGGAITYYTDRGDLAQYVSEKDADAMVAEAFAIWNGVTTAQLTVTRGGQLDEDVSGANVLRWTSLPADVMPDSGKPVAIIYDFGGQVLDALLGQGAGAAAKCEDNAALVFHDNISPAAHFSHALLILNGNCAANPLDRTFKYRLLRGVGRLLGLDWSQANENVVTGTPPPSTNDYLGFPIMSAVAKLCTFGYGCNYYSQPDKLSLDDRAALARLYPVTTATSGKVIFRDTTARVSGVVRFAPWQGLPGEAMQGVNVVAKRLDSSGKPTSTVVASSVSGFLFRGDAGNRITGTVSAAGVPGDRWGSTDSTMQGFYDLSGLEIPSGSSSAKYELHLEPLNATYAGDRSVGPYHVLTPTPSGSTPAVIVTVTPGGDLVQNFVLNGAAEPLDQREPHSITEPRPIPAGGQWSASLSGYGDVDWHSFAARAGHSFTFDLTALDDTGAVTTRKALPVAGLWDAASPADSPATAQATYFNAGRTGTTRLQANIAADGEYRIAVADFRGDGRPDYRYAARLLYIADVQPRRASTAGGTALTVTGTGFTPEVTVKVGGSDAPVLLYAADELLLQAPALPDGTRTITVTDSVTQAQAAMSDAIVYGAGAADTIAIVGRIAGPNVPIGAETESPIRARVATGDGSPVAGAAVTFTSSNADFPLLPCRSTTCLLATDATGEAAVSVLVTAEGSTTVSATLANGAHDQATVSGVAVSDAPTLWPTPAVVNLPAGSNASVPLRVRLISTAGTPLTGRQVTFALVKGTAGISPLAGVTDGNGDASTTVTVSSLASQVTVVPSLVPTSPVHSAGLNIFSVPANGEQIEKASGDDQTVTGAFAPVVVRVADRSTPPNALPGMAVHFQATAFRPGGDAKPEDSGGDLVVHHNAHDVSVASVDATISSDAFGHAAYTPSFPLSLGPLRVVVIASAGSKSVEFHLSRIGAAGIRTQQSGASDRPRTTHH